MTNILAIDPGTTKSGYVLYDGVVLKAGVLDNPEILSELVLNPLVGGISDVLAIEMIVAQGAPVGQTTFETCVWSGRFCQAYGCPEEVMWIPRREVKAGLGIPGSSNDAQVNAVILKVVGPKGTKSDPGPTFGVTSHAWAALGVALAAERRLNFENSRSKTI